MMYYKIIKTADGSDTVGFNELEKVTFHSVHGAITESRHIFIDAGLRYYAAHHATKKISVFEVGFGTGLNALLTAIAAPGLQTDIVYHAIDLNPLPVEIYAKLNYGVLLEEQELYNTIMLTGWGQELYISPFLKLKKIQGDIAGFIFEQKFDIIYFDAFAPDDQPALWDEQVFRKIYEALLPGGVLVTYCSKSVVQKSMLAAGFSIEKIPGPHGKREILRAVKK